MSGLGDALFALHSLDALASRPGVLNRMDPRAKILATLGFIVMVVSFDRYTVLALLPFALFPIALCAMGDVPLQLILRKVLMASPFALMIGIFNPLLDHTTQADLFGFGVSGGWVSFASILLRFSLTVSAALVLVATTGFYSVCGGLSQLGVPRVFTTQLMFLHRYAYVLAAEAARMSMARELRSSDGTGASLKTYGTLLGHLLLRSIDRAQRIHLAMVSRGFDGQVRRLHPAHWRHTDSVFLTVCTLGCLLGRGVDLPQFLGRFLLGLTA